MKKAATDPTTKKIEKEMKTDDKKIPLFNYFIIQFNQKTICFNFKCKF